MSDRIIVLEEKLAFLEKLVGELDDVVRDVNQRLKRTEDAVASLQKQESASQKIDLSAEDDEPFSE